MKINCLFLILSASVLVSCSEKFGPGKVGAEISVSASVVETRAGYEGTAVLPSTFVMDVDQNGSSHDYSNVAMTKDYNNSYSSAVKMLWAENTHTAAVKAMTVPYGLTDVDAVNPMAVSVATSQTRPADVIASDLLGASSDNGVTISGDNVNIAFSHLLSKLEISYEFGTGFSGSNIVRSMVLQNVCTEGGFSYLNMDFDSSVELGYDDITMYVDATNAKAEAIFYPYKPTENPTLLMTVVSNETVYTLSCPIAPKDGNGFVGGKKYKIKVSVIDSSISQTTATIEQGWNDETDDLSFATE